MSHRKVARKHQAKSLPEEMTGGESKEEREIGDIDVVTHSRGRGDIYPPDQYAPSPRATPPLPTPSPHIGCRAPRCILINTLSHTHTHREYLPIHFADRVHRRSLPKLSAALMSSPGSGTLLDGRLTMGRIHLLQIHGKN